MTCCGNDQDWYLEDTHVLSVEITDDDGVAVSVAGEVWHAALWTNPRRGEGDPVKLLEVAGTNHDVPTTGSITFTFAFTTPLTYTGPASVYFKQTVGGVETTVDHYSFVIQPKRVDGP